MVSVRQILLAVTGLYSLSVSSIAFFVFLTKNNHRKPLNLQQSYYDSKRITPYSHNFTSTDKSITTTSKPLKTFSNDVVKAFCPKFPPALKGRLNVNSTFVPTKQQIEKLVGKHLNDGCYEPKDCKANQTVAIIIPYKNRRKHLFTLLHHLHPILQRQSLRYCVFVPEQYDDGAFNKARVMNAGVLEIIKDGRYKFNCLVFHDVDMLMEDDRNLLRCGNFPRHHSPALDKFNYTVNYGTDFGGVGSVSVKQYELVNGHSNRFYGWGGEDSDIETRFKLKNITSVRTNAEFGRYKMVPHKHPWYFNPQSGLGSFHKTLGSKRFERNGMLLKNSDPSGLSTIKYSVKTVKEQKLFKKIVLDVRTFLINNVSVGFSPHRDRVEVESPAITNERLDPEKTGAKIRGFGIEAGDLFPNYDCSYKKYTSRTVNVTLGILEKKTYGVRYKILENAKSKCTELARYCGSIVEDERGVYSLRSTAFMHENFLKYKLGRRPQITVTEKHNDVSVHVKICPRDTRYLQFYPRPVVLSGNGTSPPEFAHQIEFDLQLFHVEKFKLLYYVTIYSAHKAIMQDMEEVRNRSMGVFDSLSITYRKSMVALDAYSESPDSQPNKQYEVLQQFAKQHKIYRVKTPEMSFKLQPGCYVCESVIKDQNGTPHMSWKWWFEVRGANREMEKKWSSTHIRNAKVGSTSFTEGIEKKYFRDLGIPENMGVSDDVMKMIALNWRG